MTQFKNNHGGIMINNLITIGATNMINVDGKLIGAKDNLAVNSHPFWSDIVAYSPGGTPRVTTPQPVTQNDEELADLVDKMNAHLNEDCYRFPDCVDMNNAQVSGCGKGYIKVGYDRSDCVSDIIALLSRLGNERESRTQLMTNVQGDSGLPGAAGRPRATRTSATGAARCFAATTTSSQISLTTADGRDGEFRIRLLHVSKDFSG